MSQPTKCIKFMTFWEGCFSYAIECKYLNEALRLSITIYFTKDERDNISQLGHYDAPFYEQQYMHGSYVSLFKFK